MRWFRPPEHFVCCKAFDVYSMSEQDLILVGLIVGSLVSTITLLRLITVLRMYKRHRDYTALGSSGGGIANGLLDRASASDSSRFLVPSLVFHVLLFLCLVTEVPVYACRYAATLDYGADVARPLYALHLSSYLLLFCAFCVIVTLWGDVAVFEPNRWTALLNRSLVALCFCYVLVTVVAISVCLGLGGVKYFFSSICFCLFGAYSIAALLFLGMCFLVLGCLLQRRMCTTLGCCTPRSTSRVVRLNVVMLACFICFTLRALLLANLVKVQMEGEQDEDYEKGWREWERDMTLEWALHITPCVAMLYLMRNADQPPSHDPEEEADVDVETEESSHLGSEEWDVYSGRDHGSRGRDPKAVGQARYGGVASPPESR